MENRTYHHGNLREALIDAGVALARTGGPSAVVLRAVSREAGVSHNAAYRHFADHQDLLAAVAVRCMEQLGQLMVRRTAEVAEDDPVPRACAIYRKLPSSRDTSRDSGSARPGTCVTIRRH
ncbi:TetR/AcrR family transcriptional regulator, partial [Kitasatospora sp. NPDC007106]|uniref:TetR/AcrR family transcriptional regulator n=1 Tax=Kitasatospora sp. NPDC007106 TaxID=3156914 RepID=UPI0033E2B3AE